MDFYLILFAGVGLAIVEVGVCYVVSKLKQNANTKSDVDINHMNSGTS
jgi:hypothetical protein